MIAPKIHRRLSFFEVVGFMTVKRVRKELISHVKIHQNDKACPGRPWWKFIEVVKVWGGLGSQGPPAARKSKVTRIFNAAWGSGTMTTAKRIKKSSSMWNRLSPPTPAEKLFRFFCKRTTSKYLWTRLDFPPLSPAFNFAFSPLAVSTSRIMFVDEFSFKIFHS